MRSFILFLKRIGLQKIVGVFISIVLIITAGVYVLNKPTTLPNDSQVLFDNGEYSKSIPELEAWIKQNPDDLNSIELLAATYIQKADAEPQQAKVQLSKAITLLNQIVLKNQKRSQTYRLIGTARLYQNNISAAETSFNYAIKISSGENLDAQVGLGLVLEHKGEWDKAINIYRDVLAKDPAHEAATLGVGRYHIYDKNSISARKTVSPLLLTTKNKAIKGEIYTILGSADLLNKDLTAAVDNFKQSLTIQPGNVHTAVLLGEALIGQYRFEPKKENRANLIAQIVDTANKAILIKDDYIYAYTLLYKVNILQNKYSEANQIGKKIVSLLKTDTVLKDEEKVEYEKYYSGEIKSVTITSLKTSDTSDKKQKATSTNNLKK